MSKKLFVVLVAVALVAGFAAAPASAQTISELQAQINALLAQLSGLQGGTGTGAAATCTFSRALTDGSSGADVTCLQNFLIASGHSIPAGATGYFGSQTQSAVAAWQAANGVSPAAGYFGPISQAKYNMLAGGAPPVLPPSGVPGCPAGAVYNYMTGQPCGVAAPLPAGCSQGDLFSRTTGVSCSAAPAPLPAGCTSTVGFSPTTGQSCAGTPGAPTQGTEGSITTKLAASPSANANIRNQTDVGVWGVDVKAINSDMTVDRIDLQASVTPVGGSAENPGIFIRDIKVWDDSTLLAEVATDNSSFTKDSSDRYHVIIGGIGFRVPKGEERPFKVTFTVGSISSTDVNRTVAVQGYAGNSQNIRATDTLGFQSYADMSGTANTRSHTFKPAGASTLTASLNNSLTPQEYNQKITTTNGAAKVRVLGFNAKSESGPSKITKLYVQVGGTSTVAYPDTLYICNGSDTSCSSPINSASGPTTGVNPQVVFTSLNIPVAQDETKPFFIAADYAADTNHQIASTTLPANAVQWEKPDGSTASTSNTAAISGKDVHLFDAAPKFELISTSVDSTVNSGSTVSTTTLSFTIKVKMTANGGTMVKPVASDFVVFLASSTATTSGNNADFMKYRGYAPGINGGTSVYVATTTLGSVATVINQASTTLAISGLTPTDDAVGDGDSYTLTLTSSIANRCMTSALIGGALCGGTNSAGNYRMMLVAASSTVGSNQFLLTGATPHTWGLDAFETPTAYMP